MRRSSLSADASASDEQRPPALGGRDSTLTLPRLNPGDPRRTLVATHYVRPRRFCPNLVGQLTASRGGVSAQALVQAQRTVVQRRSCFYPSERLSLEPANKI